MQPDIRIFQKRYGLSNKDMANVCQCSLPTIQKWRSGEVKPAGPAQQLMRLLDSSADGDPTKLHQVLKSMSREVGPTGSGPADDLEDLESSMTKVMDRLELMLETRRKERELAESEARYQSMVELQNEPVCRWLPDTTLTYVNHAYADLFSNFGDNLIGRKWLEFVPETKRSMIQAVVSDMVRRGEPETMIHESVGREGNLIHLEWRDFPVRNARGDVVEFHSVGRDVSELLNLRTEKEEASKLISSLMDLCEHPIVVLDKEGSFVEVNERFLEDILRGNPWTRLSEMLPDNLDVRFSKLLQRLSGTGQMNYRMSLHGLVWTLKVRLLAAHPGKEKFLIVFYQDPSPEPRNVIQTRLANEVILEGEHVDLKLDKKQVKALEKEMEKLGSETSADRIYVFTIDWEEEVFDNVLEWCGNEVESHIEDLKRIPIEDYAWWVNRIKKGQWIKQENVDRLPRTATDVKEILQAQGIRSVLVAPFEVDGEIAGFVGFDQTSHERVWHSQEVKALAAFSERAASLVMAAKLKAK